jgi:hypothetical protein
VVVDGDVEHEDLLDEVEPCPEGALLEEVQDDGDPENLLDRRVIGDGEGVPV